MNDQQSTGQQEPGADLDWRGHAIALARAIQLFRNEPALMRLVGLRKTPGYVALCLAWADYADLGGPTLTSEEIRNAR